MVVKDTWIRPAEKLVQPIGTRTHFAKPIVVVGTWGEDDGKEMALPDAFGDNATDAVLNAQANLDEWSKTEDMSKLAHAH